MKHQDTLHVVKKKKLKKVKPMIKIGKKQYIIDIENPTFVVDNKRYYHVDIHSGNVYTFNEVENIINAEDLDVIVGNKIIRELTAGVLTDKKQMLIYIGVGLLIGILLGLTIMNFVMNKRISEIYEAWNTENNPVVFPSIAGWR